MLAFQGYLSFKMTQEIRIRPINRHENENSIFGGVLSCISLGRPEIFEKSCQNRGEGAYLALTSLQIDSPLKF